MQASWPAVLWVVRHGQSAGNVARDAAEAAGLHSIDLAWRDIDVPLSELGTAQSVALGEWFARQAVDAQPEVILCSPYVRALQTARLVAQHSRLEHLTLRVDERLREKEFGMLDRLTKLGIQHHHPQLHAQRLHVGKFYFRPPGGESWCDVILRLRSLQEMVTREYGGKRVLVVAHQVIVNCMRYLIEHMDEQRILDIDREGDVPNCAVTIYRAHEPSGAPGDSGSSAAMQLVQANFLAPLRDAHTPVTREPDAATAPKP